MSEEVEVFKKRLVTIQDEISRQREDKIRIETNLEQAERVKAEVVAKIEALGYTVDNIQEAITNKSIALDNIIEKLEEEVLPKLAPSKDVLF